MKKLFVVLALIAMIGIASADSDAYVQKGDNFCTYVCLGKGGANGLQPTPQNKFMYDAHLAIIFQETIMPKQIIPCEAVAYIKKIFPSLASICDIFISAKDVSMQSIKFEESQIMLDTGKLVATATVKNTNDSGATGNIIIEVSGPKTATCTIPAQTIPGNSNADFVCAFRPAGSGDVTGATNVDLTFDKLGNYKAVAKLDAFSSDSDPVKINDFIEKYFSVSKEAKNAIPETDLLIVPILAIAVLYIISVRKRK